MYPVQIIEAWRDIKISGHLQWYPGIKISWRGGHHLSSARNWTPQIYCLFTQNIKVSSGHIPWYKDILVSRYLWEKDTIYLSAGNKRLCKSYACSLKISGHIPWYKDILESRYLWEEDTIYPVQVMGACANPMLVHWRYQGTSLDTKISWNQHICERRTPSIQCR